MPRLSCLVWTGIALTAPLLGSAVIVQSSDEEEHHAVHKVAGHKKRKSNPDRTYSESSEAAEFAEQLGLDAEIGLAVEKEVKKEVSEILETKMKFYPGLTTIAQLLEWNETTAGPRVGPAKDMPQLTNGRRIMSLHDMAGGYQELSDNDYLQMFKSWDVVDTFVYFSHVRLSVPPVQWTAAAHEHGRPALGSIVLEANHPSKVAVEDIMKNREAVLNKLVLLADHYGFDGWFFNEEAHSGWGNSSAESFVLDLKTKMKAKLGERAQVVAYPYGPEHAMFQVADGVMMDYNWQDTDKGLSKIGKAAGKRPADVYMGMDSFGALRGNNDPNPRGVKDCADHELSLAVFAPGFTLEKASERTFSLLAVDYDRRYWESIAKNFGRNSSSAGEWPVAFKPSGLSRSSLSEFIDGP